MTGVSQPPPLRPPVFHLPQDDDDNGDLELQEELLAAVCDLLPALALAAGAEAYAGVFASDHLPHLLTRCVNAFHTVSRPGV